MGRIRVRVRAGELSDNILEPLAVGRNDIIHKLLFSLLEGLGLLGQLTLNLSQALMAK